MKNAADEVKAALRAKGFDVLGYYGSGRDPHKGWVKVWWSNPPGPRHGLNAVIDRRPHDYEKEKAMCRDFDAAMDEAGWERRHGGDRRVWRRKAVTP